MRENNITFGAHSCSHAILSSLNEDEQNDEIRISKQIIEENLDEEVDTFAYPNGTRQDFNSETIEAMKNNGIKYSFTMIPGVNSKIQDKFLLRRYAAPTGIVKDYTCLMSGIHKIQS
jgi:peptidoglycan/xylan/chitin deacetylase (PgdA/CDA1 family)